MPTVEEIFYRVRKLLVEGLDVDETEVTPEARLMGDLGADSVHFLDIVFRVEKDFGIRVPDSGNFLHGIFKKQGPGVDAYIRTSRVLTDKGIAFLKEHAPWADLDGLAARNPELSVADLYTVGFLCKYVGQLLRRSAEGALVSP